MCNQFTKAVLVLHKKHVNFDELIKCNESWPGLMFNKPGNTQLIINYHNCYFCALLLLLFVCSEFLVIIFNDAQYITLTAEEFYEKTFLKKKNRSRETNQLVDLHCSMMFELFT
jgi:hypothetical protein